MASDFDNIFGGQPKSDFDAIFASGTAIAEPPGQMAPQDTPRPFGGGDVQLEAGPEQGIISRTIEKFGFDPFPKIKSTNPNDFGPFERAIFLAPDVGKAAITSLASLFSGVALNIPDIAANQFDKRVLKTKDPAKTTAELLTRFLGESQDVNLAQAAEKTAQFFNFAGRLASISKIIGPVAGVGGTVAKGALEFGGAQLVDEISKAVTDSPEFRGPPAVTEGLIIGAIFSIATLGVKKVFTSLSGTEKSAALKRLGLKKGATVDEIRKAAQKKIFKEFDPERKPELIEQFKQVVRDRDAAIAAFRAKGKPSPDIITRTTRRGRALPGEVAPEPTPPTTVAEIFKPTAQKPSAAAITPTAPAVVTPQVSEGLEAKPEAVTEKPTTISEIFAEPTITERITGPKQPEITDQTLLSERGDIKKIPQKERTPQQITRINEIEDELVLRHADEFEDIDILPKTRKIETKKVQDEITSNGIYQAELDAIGDIPNLSGSFNVDSQEIGDIKARFEGRKDILKKFDLQEEGGLRWDQAAAEIGIEKLDEFMDMVELFVDSNKAGRGAISDAALARALNSGDPSIEIFALKHDMLKNGFTAAEINKEITELASRESIDLADVEQDLISLQEITDVNKKQEILRELDKTTRKAKVKKVTEPEQIAIDKARKIAQQTQKPIFVREKDGRFTVTKVEPRQGEFIKITPAAPGETESGFERITAEPKKPKPTPEQSKETKLLIQQINIAKKIKGLSEKDFSDIKLKSGGSRRLTGRNPRTVEQLKAIMEAIQKARPKIIAHKKVITPKTEKQIAELRKNLTDLEFMSDIEFQKILDIEVRGKEAKFISARSFITQSEANNILARMHDTAQRLRVTEPFRRAVQKKPDIIEELKKVEQLPTRPKDPARLKSMRFFFQRMGERAKQPIYDVFLDLTLEEQLRSRFRHNSTKLAEKLPDFAKIANSKEALQRVEDWITSQSRLAGKPKSPKDITKNEIRLAKLVQASFESYETLARAGKMFEFFDNRAEMPQYLKFKQGIDKAFDIFNTRGYDALIKYLDTQDWGIVSAGYSPMESVIRKVSTNRMPDIAVGKGRIRPRSITYRKQDRDILQRWYSYMRQMDQLIHIQPRIKSLVRLVNDNQDSFIRPGRINSVVSTYLDNLKHTNYEDGLIEDFMRRLYSQAITVVVLGDPFKPIRNLGQNLAFSEDRRDFLDIRNKKLTAEDLEYLETHVQQSSVMMSDWAFTGEDPFDFFWIRRGIKKLTDKDLPTATKWIQRKTLYPASDRKNRLMSFHAKINRVRRAFNKKQSLAKKMTQARFSDMQKTEQRAALEILAKDGVDPMARFVAKVHTDNTHFLYGRESRSPAEQTKAGKIGLNLFLFRRAALEKAVLQLGKVIEKGTGFNKKRRAASVFVSLITFSVLTGVIWKKLTGQRYNPYSYVGFLELEFGGLMVGILDKVTNVYNSMLSIVTLDPVKGGKAADKFISDMTEAADMLLPFYDLGWRALEATIGTENIDKQLGKKIREAIDSEFKSRGLKEIDRSLVQKLQFALAKGKQTKKDKDNFTFTGTKE